MLHVCICVHKYVHEYMCIYVFVWTLVRICIYLYMCVDMFVNALVCMCWFCEKWHVEQIATSPLGHLFLTKGRVVYVLCTCTCWHYDSECQTFLTLVVQKRLQPYHSLCLWVYLIRLHHILYHNIIFSSQLTVIGLAYLLECTIFWEMAGFFCSSLCLIAYYTEVPQWLFLEWTDQ